MRKTLTIPDAVATDVAERARLRGVDEAEMYRNMLKMGLLWERIESDPNQVLILREGEREREIVWGPHF